MRVMYEMYGPGRTHPCATLSPIIRAADAPGSPLILTLDAHPLAG